MTKTDIFLKDRPSMKEVKFYFDDDKLFDGYHDGTTWNGFQNIWVTKDVHKQVIKHFENDIDCDLNTIEPDKYGMFSYSYGYCTSINDWRNKPILTLKEFKKTRKKVDLNFMRDMYSFGDYGGQSVDDSNHIDPEFFVYGVDGELGWIEIRNTENSNNSMKYFLQISNWDNCSDDLNYFEKKLYQDHYLNNI